MQNNRHLSSLANFCVLFVDENSNIQVRWLMGRVDLRNSKFFNHFVRNIYRKWVRKVNGLTTTTGEISLREKNYIELDFCEDRVMS